LFTVGKAIQRISVLRVMPVVKVRTLSNRRSPFSTVTGLAKC
jgi:hypothetical protein